MCGGACSSSGLWAQPPASGTEGRTPRPPAPQNLSRGLVNVATKLTHNKDVRDLFVDLVEKVSCPACRPLIPTLAVPELYQCCMFPWAHSSWNPAALTTGH